MPTELGAPYTPNWTGYPPGMARDDYALWILYRPTIPDNVERIYFNVFLGPGPADSPEIPAELKDFWRRKNQLRADVILEFPDRVRIVEFRKNASTGTMGRLQAYSMLLRMDNPFTQPVELEIVTDRTAQILESLTRQAGIILTIL